MIRLGVRSGMREKLMGGERIIFDLSYGWVIQGHNNHNIVF